MVKFCSIDPIFTFFVFDCIGYRDFVLHVLFIIGQLLIHKNGLVITHLAHRGCFIGII